MRPAPLLALALAALLPACSPADEPAAPPDNAVVAEPETPAPATVATGATVGGDGSDIILSPLTAADIDGAKLAGELACSFGEGDATLLIAKGDVASREHAFGVVKVGTYVEPVSAPGGFDGMLKGVTFAGKGKTIRIALTGPATAGGESPPSPATLTYQRADGAERVLPGTWTCGP